MFKTLQIKNFKGWKDTGVIRMAPITLFFGANSSGKSSIGQFLMMLKQTAESSDRKTVFYPGGRNSAVQLGSYKEMVFRRDIKNKISFEYQWELPTALDVRDPISVKSYSGNTLDFSAEVGINDKEQNTVMLDSFAYRLKEGEDTKLSLNMIRKTDNKSEYEVKSDDYGLRRKQGRAWLPPAPVRFYGFPDEVVAYHQNADFVQELNLRHEQLLRAIHYLGPLRTKTDRLYSWAGTEPESVAYAGENTVPAILAARKQKRKIALRSRRHGKPFEEIIASKLQEMGLIEKFEVKKIATDRQEYEVKICTKGSGEWVDLPDVGFGISQVLPVLVECFYAPPGSIIIMEQPEIHLHPKAQSVLADVMIDVINSRENGQDRNIQLIIETHSEHFLRRLQRRIAEEAVDKEKVSAYFANIENTPAILETLEIDMFGNILNWPENFFGDEMEDVINQAKAALQRRKKASEKAEGIV